MKVGLKDESGTFKDESGSQARDHFPPGRHGDPGSTHCGAPPRQPASTTISPRADSAAPEVHAAGHLLRHPAITPSQQGLTLDINNKDISGNHSSLPHPFTVEKMRTGRTASRLPSSPSSRLGVHSHMLQLRHKTTVPPAPA